MIILLYSLPTLIITEKTEKADTIRNNGCFDSKSLVETPEGSVEMSQLQTNDLVLTMNSQGQLQFSPIIMWLDRDESGQELFVELKTKSNRLIRLTSSHLIYIADEPFDLTHSSSSSAQTKYDYNERKQQQMLPTQFTPVEKVNSGNIDIKHHYYHYDVDNQIGDSTTKGKLYSDYQSDSNTKTMTNVPNTFNSYLKSKTDMLQDEHSTVATPNLSIDDFAFTTYSRNVIVGQYLLTKSSSNSNASKKLSMNPTRTVEREEESSSSDRPSKNIMYQTDNNDKRPIGRLIFNDYSKDDVQEDSRLTSSDSTIKLDQIVGVDYRIRRGIYAPLTREGNIVVNSVVASCYAVISDQDLAHMSFAPVRWFSYLKEWIFGLDSATKMPLQERTVEAIKRSQLENEELLEEEATKQDTQIIQSIDIESIPPKIALFSTYNQEMPDSPIITPSTTSREIHWYPRMLYRIARFILPSEYLY